MKAVVRTALVLFGVSSLLSACGGSDGPAEEPLNTDYSSLRIAASREGALVSATHPGAILNPLKNGVRLSLGATPNPAANAVSAPLANGVSSFSGTTVQVEGVDEADLVKYDGQHIYVVRPEPAPAFPGMTRNVLAIVL